MEGALKSSFRPDISLKTAPFYHQHHQHQQQVFLDDSSAVGNVQNAVLGGDDLFVEGLLDFSNAVVEEPEEHNNVNKQEETLENDDDDEDTVNKAAAAAVSSVSVVTSSATLSVKDEDFGSLAASELIVPVKKKKMRFAELFPSFFVSFFIMGEEKTEEKWVVLFCFFNRQMIWRV